LRRLSRRDFLVLSGGAAAAAAVGAAAGLGLLKTPAPLTETKTMTEALTSTLTETLTSTASKTEVLTSTLTETVTSMASKTEASSSSYVEPGKSLVSVVTGRDPAELVDRAVGMIGGLDMMVDPGARVVVKPNAGFSQADATTDPRVLAEVVKLAFEAGASEVVVADSSVRGSDTSFNFQKTGIGRAAEEAGAVLRDLRRDTASSVSIPMGRVLDRIDVWNTIVEADVLICVPKLKRHVDAEVTISLKNMIGAVTDEGKGLMHRRGISQAIADLNTVVKPDLVIVDALKAMTRGGPTAGQMVSLETVIASHDPVAADLIAAERLFKAEQDPNPLQAANAVPHIQDAAALGVGTNDPDRISRLEAEA